MSTALLYPGPTLLLLEASSLGLALVLFAGLLYRSVARRRGMLRTESSSSIFDRGSTQTLQPAPINASEEPTETAPDAMPLSNVDSES